MRVCRIAHAGLIVEAGGLRCLMDPVLVQPFECGANLFEPAVEIDAEAAARGRYDFVILSHEHGDHFCVESLSRLDRALPVLFPAGCELIARALRTMGFREPRPVAPGSWMRAGSVELGFTPSNVPFPEMGVLFSAEGRHFWNAVDSVIDDRAFAMVDRLGGRLDLMFGQYQTLIEQPLGLDALGASFPYARHGKNLLDAARAAPRCLVPSSCAYRFATETWQNSRGFPLSEAEFLADLAGVAPGIAGRFVPPGAAIDVATLAVTENALPFLRRGAARPVSLAWRPDRGVPPLADDDPGGHGSEALRRQVSKVLEEVLPRKLRHPLQWEWRERLGQANVAWQLEIVYPDGTSEMRWLDFAAGAGAWLAAPPRVPKIVTTLTASTLAGLVSGEIVPYRAIFTRRVVLKLYGVSPRGLEQVGGLADEPVAKLLFPDANSRHVDWQLARLGYSAEDSKAGLRGVARLPRRR